MNRILLHMDCKESISVMCDGNPGAINVMCAMIKHDPIKGQVGLCHLDDMEIYGSDIWIAYKDVCKQDMPTFIDRIFDRDLKEDVVKLRNPS